MAKCQHGNGVYSCICCIHFVTSIALHTLEQGHLRPLRTMLKEYNFSQGGQLLGLQGGGSHCSTSTWPEVFCDSKMHQIHFKPRLRPWPHWKFYAS